MAELPTDIEGFNLERIKKNFSAGVNIDIEPLRLDYVKAFVDREQAIEGYTLGGTRNLLNALERGHRASTNTLDVAIRHTISNQDFVSDPYQTKLRSQAAAVGGAGLEDRDFNSAAAKIGAQIRERFVDRYGRDATQGEVSGIFNQLTFSNTEIATSMDEPSIKRLLP